jgi:flagellar M-ring protein FliF
MEENGAILVDRRDVYKTRIKLMGRDIPLHGAVGFELFNNNDLGMTEFAQKINYQRALQGELTRTILSLAEVRDARVLLALPEQGLFKQSNVKPKASVTLSMKQGQALRGEQVAGIQRLVSAAVPGIVPQDVTIVDQSGVALTRMAGEAADGDAGGGSLRLDLKKDTESYLSRKATAVLERALGAGQALASVDVMLNMDRVRVDTNEVIGVPGKAGATPTGVITRQRESTREMGPPLGGLSTGSGGGPGGSNQLEVDYAPGRRVEQVISQPGSVRRIQVAVVVRKPLAQAQLDSLRTMVAASVGASLERGDTVVVQSLESFHAPDSASAPVALSVPTESPKARVPGVSAPGATEPVGAGLPQWPDRALVVAGVGVLLLILLAWSTRRRAVAVARPVAVLSDAQRREALARIQGWMLGHTDAGSPAGRAGQSGDRPPLGGTP